MLCKALFAATMLLALAACGSSTTDRGLSGGAIGAATGVLTDEDDVDLGEPVWRR